MPTAPMRTPRRLLVAALSFALLADSHWSAAADTSPPKVAGAPPRIAVALSGGGARGIAHVGVLKVLEEMHIPITCITGTSMGSIVAGAYAVGRSPEDIEKMVLATNWDEIFRDNPPRAEISTRRKVDDYKTLFAPEFGIKNGSLAVPKGIIAGVSIEAFLRVVAEPATGISDFDKLPVPFRAVATDIETGEAVVLSHGNVAEAMRASMSVPGAITPVQMDGHLLVDGMIANNLPIDQARKLCGDVVIAVNIGTPPLKRDEITSALAVVSQMMAFLGKQTVDEQLKRMGPDDVLIVPDLGDISVAKYDRAKDAIKIGEEATRKMAASLARYSIPPEQYAALRAKQAAPTVALGAVDEIRFEGLQRTNPEVLRGLVETKPGEPLDEEKIGADLRRIYGRGDFEGVDARVIGSAGGPRAMVITPQEKDWGPDYLRFGLGLESDFQGDNAFNLLVQYRKTCSTSWVANGSRKARSGRTRI
jgi:NTE family protein